ncbi:MAG: hypothetical protein HFI73_05105 [Bacilli bacterium]|jgi:hypothetical protein|nr:hypothetical protein [Bacilli bacterium]
MDNHELQNTSQEVQNSNVTDQTSYVDPRTIEAEIIGELRKDKIGRPILVVQMFIIFGIVLISLPIFTSLLNNPSSFLYKMFNSNGISDAPVTPSDDKREEFLNGGVEQQLASSTNMKFENIVMRNFTLNGNYLNCEMYSYNGVLNLDKENYFLEIYSSGSKNKIASVKLVGSFDNQVQKVSLTANQLSFNGNYSYVGKIVEMKDADYPSYTVPSDESGVGSMICSMDGRSIEYTFKNNYLISIKDNVKVVLSEQKDSQAYLNLKKSYEDKANNLGVNAEVEEVADGFSFTSVLDLENYKVPSSVVDYNYYLLDTEAKVINYTLNGKGFDCK